MPLPAALPSAKSCRCPKAAGYQPPVPVYKSMRAEAASADVPIAQGEQVIAVDVNITWEIK